MTENDLREHLRDDYIIDAARHFPFRNLEMASDVYFAIECWMALNILAWLHRWRGPQSVIVMRVWKWFDDRVRHVAGDIDLLVGAGGRDRQYKVLVTVIGGATLRLSIVKFVNGVQTPVWNRVGQCIDGVGDDDLEWYDVHTLPVETDELAHAQRHPLLINGEHYHRNTF